MPRNVTRDKSIRRVDAAAGRASAKGSGSAGGSLKGMNFTPGTREAFTSKKK